MQPDCPSSRRGERNVPDFQEFMKLAIEEAEASLREGNSGFGAVIAQDGRIISRAHDTEKTDLDPTAHAELTAIRKAASLLGRHLDGCLILSTHEPCPMCAAAIVWSGIKEVGYGCSIKEALEQGRKRIDLSCRRYSNGPGKALLFTKACCTTAVSSCTTGRSGSRWIGCEMPTKGRSAIRLPR